MLALAGVFTESIVRLQDYVGIPDAAGLNAANSLASIAVAYSRVLTLRQFLAAIRKHVIVAGNSH